MIRRIHLIFQKLSSYLILIFRNIHFQKGVWRYSIENLADSHQALIVQVSNSTIYQPQPFIQPNQQPNTTIYPTSNQIQIFIEPATKYNHLSKNNQLTYSAIHQPQPTTKSFEKANSPLVPPTAYHRRAF